MMFWTTVAIAMTVLMGGIIAYNGDLIGRKYGKKRLSLFGLRPKHTAILITSVTGGAISFLTMAVLFLLVPPVRNIILQGEAAIAERARSVAEARAARSELVKSQSALSGLEGRMAEKQKQIAVAEREIADLRRQRDKFAAEKSGAETRLAAARAELRPMQEKLTEARQEYAAARSRNRDLAVKNAGLAEKNETLVQANGVLANQQQLLAGKNAALTTEIAEKEKQNTELASSLDERSMRNIALTRENAALTKENDVRRRTSELLLSQIGELTETRNALTQSNAMLAEANTRLESENTVLAKSNKELTELVRQIAPNYNSLADAVYAARSRRIAIHKDEDLARIVVPANCSPEAVREVINDLMHRASQAAREKGAGSGETARAVHVVDRQFIQAGADGRPRSVVEISGSERVDAVVSRLSWQTVPMAVLAIAVSNSVEEEPAAIDLQPFPNRVVYKKGQTVYLKRLNGQQTSDRIFTEVVAFLKELGVEALKQGVIPRIDAMTGQPQVGSLGAEEIVSLVERVRQIGGRVRLKAVAKADVASAGPMDLNYVVEP